jgi:hypothetical protein
VIRLGDVYCRIEAGPAGVDAPLEAARERHDADARRLDRELDRLLQRLAADADAFDTDILIVSDRGESFGEDGSIGHGKSLSDPLIHHPCLLLSPAVAPGREATPVGSVDVPATLVALAGLDGLAGAGRDRTAALLPERSVFGMRRTFEKPFEELRIDGRRHRLPELAFFVADRERVVVGNGEQAMVRAVRPGAEPQIPGAGTSSDLDPQFRDALEALDYIH